jgi:cytochrome c-type protein NapB
MKMINKITIGLFTTTLMFVGCSDSATPTSNKSVKATISEKSLGLRKTDLYTESSTKSDKTMYLKNYAGSGVTISRAFQDAPPMIPHDVEGMLPIKINSNQCIDCHDPAVAKSMGATSLPKSHFTNFRPDTSLTKDGKIVKNGKVVQNTSSEDLHDISIKEQETLAGARFNCSQCHAPQSDSAGPKNLFTPDFTSEDGASKSSWNGTKLMEGIDTTQ